MPEDSTSGKALGARRWLAPACVGLSFVGMAAQLFSKIDRHAVNILFSDQWATYTPLFDDYGAWGSFAMQYGPHRMGAGTFVTWAVAAASGWDVRAETFVIGCILILTTAAALYLKWRLFGELTAWDALIPLLCLSLPTVQAHVVLPFPSYSAVPVLLLVLYAISLTLTDVRLKYCAVAVLNFLLVFTAWGVFAGPLTPFLLGYLVLFGSAARDRRARRWALFALAASILSLALFFVGYVFVPAVDCFRFPHYPLTDYLWFVSHLFSNAAAVKCGATRYFISKSVWALLVKGFGLALVSAAVLALAFRLRGLFRRDGEESRNLVVVLFIGFSLLFALNAAFGRVCTGDCASNSERYLGLLTPAWLGLYFFASGLRTRFRRTAALTLLLACCFVLPQLRASTYEGTMRLYRESKIKWRDCYLRHEDAARCDEEAGMSIFAPNPSPMVQARLDYLKGKRLNFFADR